MSDKAYFVDDFSINAFYIDLPEGKVYYSLMKLIELEKTAAERRKALEINYHEELEATRNQFPDPGEMSYGTWVANYKDEYDKAIESKKLALTDMKNEFDSIQGPSEIYITPSGDVTKTIFGLVIYEMPEKFVKLKDFPISDMKHMKINHPELF